MEQSDIDKLLALRSAWDKFKAIQGEKSAKDFDAFYKVFWSYGMEGHIDIAAFNDSMCMQFLRDHCTAHGKCDGCKGYKDIPQCFALWGSLSCAVDPKSIDFEFYYLLLFKCIRLGLHPPVVDGSAVQTKVWPTSGFGKPLRIYIYDNKINFVCPPGHGYYDDYNIPFEKAPFDLYWTP